jgi:hypothetical protein
MPFARQGETDPGDDEADRIGKCQPPSDESHDGRNDKQADRGGDDIHGGL